jgi:hypothetical protein
MGGPGIGSVRKEDAEENIYSPPTSAEVKKMWIYISTPPYVFME